MKHIAITLLLGALCGSNALAQTETDAANLLFLKQEEKVARDVYLTLGELWGHPTFLNIAQSEQRHMDAVNRLITLYGLEDTTPEAVGEFTIPELQALHDTLVAAGFNTVEEALAVGVLVEETDIDDIEEMLGQTTDPTIIRVLTNLQKGSYQHLDAFTRALENPDSTPGTGTGPGAGVGAGRQGGRGGQAGTCVGQQTGTGRQAGNRSAGQSRQGNRQAGAGNNGTCVQPTAAVPQRQRASF
ncbi:MAG: DUF2202 domain-containing protein [Verrucomicrobiae bacterium]|nr:DUF2202 domain-containing protein [Verrucomicrobiae bacterium]